MNERERETERKRVKSVTYTSTVYQRNYVWDCLWNRANGSLLLFVEKFHSYRKTDGNDQIPKNKSNIQMQSTKRAYNSTWDRKGEWETESERKGERWGAEKPECIQSLNMHAYPTENYNNM